MRIGVPKEIKDQESRVGLTPASVQELVASGHDVLVQRGAGLGIGFDDTTYVAVGADLAADADEVFERSSLIVKVKEPQPDECARLRPEHVLLTYLHLAADPVLAELLCRSGCTAIAYETVTDASGRLPLLAPMSEIAGRMAAQVGAVALQTAGGGRGVLIGGVPGVAPAHVVVLGGGVVGTNAARMALGLGGDVTVVDRSIARLAVLDNDFGPRLKTCFSTLAAVRDLIATADLVIGAVLIAGAAAPRLVSREDLKSMRHGAVLVDVSIDQGGCFETSRATTHADPTYLVDGIVHYCVANMPGAVARTSAQALNNATLPFVRALADLGWRDALASDPGFGNGLNVEGGCVRHPVVATALAALGAV